MIIDICYFKLLGGRAGYSLQVRPRLNQTHFGLFAAIPAATFVTQTSSVLQKGDKSKRKIVRSPTLFILTLMATNSTPMKIKLLFVISFFLLIACGGDSVQKDLLNYVNEGIQPLASLESEAIDAYGSVSGENYESDSAMYYTMVETVIPKYEEFYSKLQAIKPTTEEVSKMHQEYIEGAADQLEAFRLIREAIEKQDIDIINTANTDLDKARDLLALWRKDLEEKCKTHNIELE